MSPGLVAQVNMDDCNVEIQGYRVQYRLANYQKPIAKKKAAIAGSLPKNPQEKLLKLNGI